MRLIHPRVALAAALALACCTAYAQSSVQGDAVVFGRSVYNADGTTRASSLFLVDPEGIVQFHAYDEPSSEKSLAGRDQPPAFKRSFGRLPNFLKPLRNTCGRPADSAYISVFDKPSVTSDILGSPFFGNMPASAKSTRPLDNNR